MKSPLAMKLPLACALIFAMGGCGGPPAPPVDSTASATPPAIVAGDFRAPLGVQLWSFRTLSGDVPAMLSTIRGMNFTHVETAGLYTKSRTEFAEALRSAGLKATSMHVGYDDLN